MNEYPLTTNSRVQMKHLPTKTALLTAAALAAAFLVGCDRYSRDHITLSGSVNIYDPPPPREVVIVREAPPQPVVYVRQAPPPPHREIIVASPGPGYIWVNGYWASDGQRWVWVGGHWEHPPRATAVWVEPRWEHRGDRFEFSAGFWR